ncbi:MAG: GntR family transcriptional regulator [Armatimonadota bacterium]
MFDSIDPKSALPIYRQISDQIRWRVAAGVFAPGDRLPSVRELAAQLLVNPNTVAKVYRDLEREGLLETRRGDGTYISNDAGALAASERRRIIEEQLRSTARDARAFGLEGEAAVELFRRILSEKPAQRKDRR